MKTVKLFFVLAACAFSLGGNAQQGPIMPPDPAVRYGKLPNGLTYYIRHNEYPKERVDFYIAQRVGSINEEENQRGLAHFLEHMAFNGSKHFPESGDLMHFCENIGVQYGGDLNAYTSVDETVYNVCSVPSTKPGNLDSCLYILADWADGLTLSPAEIDKERGVIHEEWRMRSSATQRMFERDLSRIYPGSRYGHRMPIGLMSVVDGCKPAVLRAYYEKWYRPDNQGIIIVGNVDVDQVEQKVKALFGPIQMPKNPAKRVYYDVPDNDKAIVVVDKDKEMQQPFIMLDLKYKATPDSLKNSMEYIVENFLRSRAISMLNTRLQEAQQKADAPFNFAAGDDGEFVFAKTERAFELQMMPKNGQDAAALKAVAAEALRAAKFGFVENEWIREQDEYGSRLDKALTGKDKLENDYYTQKYIRNFLDNEPYSSVENEVMIERQLLKALPLKAVNAMMANMVSSLDTNAVVIAFYPDKEGVAVPDSNALRTALASVKDMPLTPYVDNTKKEPLIEKMPKPGTIKKELPADKFGYKGFILSNGIKVLYKKTDFKDDEVNMKAISKGGTSLLPLKDLTNASLVNSIMGDNGLGKFNSIELKKQTAGKQVGVSPSLGYLSESMNGSCVPKDLRTMLEVNYLYFTNVNYDTLAYQTNMRQITEAYKNRSANPQTAFSDSLNVTILQHNPRTAPMTLARLKNVNYDEILRIFHERFGNPGDFTYVFTGALNEDSLRTMAMQYIASLPVKGKPEKWVDQHQDYWKGTVENRFTHKMETPTAYFIQYWNGPMTMTAKNSVVADATGQVLSMVYDKTVREDASLVYSISSQAAVRRGTKDDYVMLTVCPVSPEKADSAELIVNTELKKIAEKGPDEQMLSRVKEFMLKNYADNLRKNDYWQGLEDGLIFDGYDSQTGVKEAIESLTPADIQKFVQTVMKQNNKATVEMMPQK
jgi:zinc protease